MREPRRLARRYAGNAFGLARHLPQQIAAYAFQGRQSRLPQLRVARNFQPLEALTLHDATLVLLSADAAEIGFDLIEKLAHVTDCSAR